MEPLTLGIEEEYQIIDPETRELTSFITEFLEQGAMVFRDQMKPEFLQSQVEVGSNVCQNIKEAKFEIKRLRSMVHEVAQRNNRHFVAAGTHPFSRWEDQRVTNHERYHMLLGNMRILAQRLLIFGMHVHVGIPDRNLQIDIMNQMAYFMPHLLALSTSSPFWWGRNTGLKSYRSIIFEDLPRTGVPEQFDSAMEYDQYVDTLVRTGCIDEPTKIWWDIRPHPKFPTLEFRVCDCTTKVDEVIAITGMIQALVAKMIQLRRRNQTWRLYRRTLLAENKFRSIKNGLDGSLIDFGKEREVPLRELMEEMLDFVDDVLDPLDSREEVEYIRVMLENGSSADRQLAKFEETGDLKDVVDMLVEETIEGCDT